VFFLTSFLIERNQASLTKSAMSSSKLRTPLHALAEERHFALVGGFALPTVGSLVIVSGQEYQSDPCISSICNWRIMITTSNSSSNKEEQDPQSITRCSTEHHRLFRAVLRANRI
jgi:hypothetical protein